MPNSLATASARSRFRLAIETIFAPMQSRKPGIWVVRANPVPTIPIPTGDFFMACNTLPQRYRSYMTHRTYIFLDLFSARETRDDRHELRGGDRFGDVHLIAGRERLA